MELFFFLSDFYTSPDTLDTRVIEIRIEDPIASSSFTYCGIGRVSGGIGTVSLDTDTGSRVSPN